MTALKKEITLAGITNKVVAVNVDVDAEISRINKLIETANKEIARSAGKLKNERFVSSAPEAVVNKEKNNLASNEHKLDELNAQLNKLNNLS